MAALYKGSENDLKVMLTCQRQNPEVFLMLQNSKRRCENRSLVLQLQLTVKMSITLLTTLFLSKSQVCAN